MGERPPDAGHEAGDASLHARATELISPPEEPAIPEPFPPPGEADPPQPAVVPEPQPGGPPPPQ